MTRRVGLILVLAAVLSAGARNVHAKAAWLKKAQAEDPTIKDCMACHTSKKGRELNAGRGQFLMDRKSELGASAVDLKWLKDYKEATSETAAAGSSEPAAALTPTPTPTPTPESSK